MARRKSLILTANNNIAMELEGVLSITSILRALKLLSRIELSSTNDVVTLENTKGHQGTREMTYLIAADSASQRSNLIEKVRFQSLIEFHLHLNQRLVNFFLIIK